MKRIILFYSHQDEEWKNLILAHLGVLGTDLVRVWNDTQIETNSNWFHEIRRDFNESGAAVLLISSDFLLSGLIREAGVPELLEEYGKKNDLKVIPIIVRACPWKWVKWLDNLKVFPKEGKPLSISSQTEGESILKDMVKMLYRLVSVEDIPVGVSEPSSVKGRLFLGSRVYYDALRGPNGRFRHLNISEILLPGTESKLIDTNVSIAAMVATIIGTGRNG
jgi:hypothetical protein